MIPELTISYISKLQSYKKPFKKRMNQVSYIPVKKRPSKTQGIGQNFQSIISKIFPKFDFEFNMLLKEAVNKSKSRFV